MSHFLGEVNKNPYFGFIQRHDHLSQEDLADIEQWVGYDEPQVVEEFAQQFSAVIEADQNPARQVQRYEKGHLLISISKRVSSGSITETVDMYGKMLKLVRNSPPK